jgi:Hemerythrin HHE cation binding domain
MTGTQRVVAANRPDAISFTEMYVTHDGFRRDLERLAVAAAAGRGGSSSVHDGWQNFKRQLHVHHAVEDTWMWPRLMELVAGRADDLALLGEMGLNTRSSIRCRRRWTRACATDRPLCPITSSSCGPCSTGTWRTRRTRRCPSSSP